ncbi:MAG TPA: T9SS type A sorting domain-containing protein, partial [Bacteroidia bacterium]|nr:T9SS type A sorting domain-containing protein [Bacteroidia bacterium]
SIPVNDSIVQEVVVVDTTQPSVRLSYTRNQTDQVGAIISWGGGSGGVGMYFIPPTYPARILNTNFVIPFAPSSGVAFYSKIYADDGPAGGPGTLLDSEAVQATSINLNGLTIVPVTNNVVLTSGGYYVLWDMANPSVGIAEDVTPPFSRRSYEVIQGYWSTYRDYQVSDFFIGSDYFSGAPEDVGVSSIFNPQPNAAITGSGTNVSCWIKNYGGSPDNYFITVNYKLGNYPNIVSQPYTGPAILPGDSVLFTFSTPLVAPGFGNDILYVWTQKTLDVDHSNDTDRVAVNLVGMNELSAIPGLRVSPVPANDHVTFTFASGLPGDGVIIITDLSGKIVAQKKTGVLAPGEKTEIDISSLANGAYFYTVKTAEQTANGKIVKTD